MADDRWRPVPGWPGYEASYGGDVRSLFRGLPYVLRRGRNRKGYPTVTVCQGSRSSTKPVHVLVALAWLPPAPKGKSQVRHLDGVKGNCAVWNLRYGDQADQEQDKRHAGTSRVKRGTGRNGRENREIDGIETGASRAGLIETTRTFR